MGGEWVDTRTGEIHRCAPPSRLLPAVRRGAVWRCECDNLFVWTSGGHTRSGGYTSPRWKPATLAQRWHYRKAGRRPRPAAV